MPLERKNKITFETGIDPPLKGAMCKYPVIGSEWVVTNIKNREKLTT